MMTKRFYIVALVASVSFVVAGLYAAQQPENGSIINPAPVVVRDRFSDVSNQYGWGLPSASIEEVRSDLLTWANRVTEAALISLSGMPLDCQTLVLIRYLLYGLCHYWIFRFSRF